MAFPGSITLLPNVIQSSDGNYVESFNIPGTPYTYKLGTGSPLNYPTGMQVIPPAGVSNAVVITGGGYGSWTQVTSAPAAGQFTVDTSVSPTGGQVGFNSADAGKSVTATYVANTYVNEGLLQAFVTALRDLNTARGAANGFAALDGSTNLVVPSGHKISAPGQTGGVANQVVGLVNIPNNSADGTQTTVANTLVTTTSTIIVTMASIPGDCTSVAEIPSARVAGTSFKVQNKGATSSTGGHGLDVAYLIIN